MTLSTERGALQSSMLAGTDIDLILAERADA